MFGIFGTVLAVFIAAAGVAFTCRSQSNRVLSECPVAPILNGSAEASRLVFIGDVHGSSQGLHEILEGAGLISALDDNDYGRCVRLPTSSNDVVVDNVI